MGTQEIVWPSQRFMITQGVSVKQKQQILSVTVPELGTIFLKNGNSYTGKLTAFNAQSLTLSVGDYSQSFPLKDVQKIDFSLDDVWIEIERGRRQRLPIRGIPIGIDNIPLSGFTLNKSKITGQINLAHLPPDQFEKLTKDPKKIKVIKTIIVEKNQTLTIKIVNSK